MTVGNQNRRIALLWIKGIVRKIRMQEGNRKWRYSDGRRTRGEVRSAAFGQGVEDEQEQVTQLEGALQAKGWNKGAETGGAGPFTSSSSALSLP